MNDHAVLIFAAAMIFTYGLFSKIADRSPVTPLNIDIFKILAIVKYYRYSNNPVAIPPAYWLFHLYIKL